MSEAPKLRVLVIGRGGREHALAWAIARSPQVETVYVAPGNGGTAGEDKVENVPLTENDLEGLASFAKQRKVGLTIVGPEDALAKGVVDHFHAHDLPVFGPTRDAARLETSKIWSREFMARHGIPHPAFEVCHDVEAARAAVLELEGHCVVKCDGLAAGKGVAVCEEVEEALTAVDDMMVKRIFGDAGSQLLVEERRDGVELSVMALCDGTEYVLLPPSQDHKRLLERDRGPNTGGMGAYAPAPLGTPKMLDAVRQQVIEPTLAGMRAEGTPFVGCLYVGLMVDERGITVIEYNARFGDPETQVQLPLVASDLAAVLLAATQGRVATQPISFIEDATAVCIVLAARGYPFSPQRGFVIDGLATAESRPGIKVFHAGTKRDDVQIKSSGGRVLNVVCVRNGLQPAVTGAYSAIGAAGVHFEGMAYRTDIAFRALSAPTR